MRSRLIPILVLVSLVLAAVPTAAEGVVELHPKAPLEKVVPLESPDGGAANHSDKDAECFAEVPIFGHGSCTDTWEQGPGNFTADWHSTFHDLWTVGDLSLTVRDGAGRVVFQRDCQWLGVTGLCIVQIEDGAPGNWTMELNGHVDATVGAASTAHGWFDLQPAD